MTCQACASRIEKVLNKKDFVESAGVNFASEEAQVTFDDSQTSAADIAKIIEKTGYGAKEKTEDALPQPEEAAHVSWRLWLLLAINIPFLIGMAGDDRAARLDDSACMAVCAGERGAALAGGAVLQKRVGKH